MVAATAAPLEYVRVTCCDCHGSGQTTELYPGCAECRAYWRPLCFDAWIEAHDRPHWFRRNRYRWNVALPCSHPLTALAYEPLACATCRGVGTVGHWELSRAFRERITPPAPRTSYRPARYPPVAPMHTPLLAETTRKSLTVFDWQRGRYWQ